MTEENPPAPFWLRAGALTIDAFILFVANVFIQGMTMSGIPWIVSGLSTLLLPLAYFAWWPVKHDGQTPGKAVAGIAIMRVNGETLGYGRALLRWVGYALSGLTGGIGFVSAAFRKDGATLHDWLAGTRVRRVADITPARKFFVYATGALLPFLFLLIVIAGALGPMLRSRGEVEAEGTQAAMLRIRAAKSEFYAAKSRFPKSFEELVPSYLPEIPLLKTGMHPESAELTVYGGEICTGSVTPGQTVDPTKLNDSGRWAFVVDEKAACNGFAFVDCTHPDSQGRPWHQF